MYDKKLSFKDYLFIGSMLFGLFLVLEILSFPFIWVKKQALLPLGESRFLGYRYRSSFLGVIAIGVSKSSGVYELAKRINQTYAMVLPSCFT